MVDCFLCLVTVNALYLQLQLHRHRLVRCVVVSVMVFCGVVVAAGRDACVVNRRGFNRPASPGSKVKYNGRVVL